MKVTLIAGARPNFMKIGPIINAIKKAKQNGGNIDYRLVHTGQHYDEKLSKIFFDELEIPKPHVNLEIGSGSQAEQTGKIMIAFERDLMDYPADLVIVVGDVNSTMACTIVAKKMLVKVAHVEAGIRSYDMEMPEEINRIVTDSLADYFFTTTIIAGDNLIKMGVDSSRIYLVGNTMIDSLKANLSRVTKPSFWDEHKLQSKNYFVLTLHRPSNVDDSIRFEALITAINNSVKNLFVVFPVHPRTQRHLETMRNKSQIIACEPQGYLDFIYLIKNAKAVITDSGGVQEETTYLGIPCITLRKNTERPETVSIGTNEIIGDDLELLSKSINKIENMEWKRGAIPEFWDGDTATRIVNIITAYNFLSDPII